jgi:hypothetical protein
MAQGNPQAFVEVMTTTNIIAAAGLAGETKIAVLNNSIDVYAIEPTPPGPLIAALYDPAQPGDLHVTGFHAGVSLPLTQYQVTSITTDAATSAGYPVQNIYEVP